MTATTVRVNLGDRSYAIAVRQKALASFPAFVRGCWSGTCVVVVADANTADLASCHADALASAGLRTEVALVPAGEGSKSLEQASRLYDTLAESQVDRGTLVVALGGGVVGDLAGFVAATYLRGLPFLIVPTSLLAMVDSSVGGKVGVNHPRGKNLIGAFAQPVGVWIDLAALDTLPEREYRSGLAEVVKYGVILDAPFFEMLERSASALLQREPGVLLEVVACCCQLKADVVAKDERETSGARAALNYGHTFAHAFEAVAGYGTWLHGEAVAAGMVCASALAERLGLIAADITRRQRDLLACLHLPVRPDASWPVDALLAAMHSDKKTLHGKLRFVLPTRLGEVRLVNDVPKAAVQAVLEACGRSA
jgi:3-dehydroquinate synthase